MFPSWNICVDMMPMLKSLSTWSLFRKTFSSHLTEHLISWDRILYLLLFQHSQTHSFDSCLLLGFIQNVLARISDHLPCRIAFYFCTCTSDRIFDQYQSKYACWTCVIVSLTNSKCNREIPSTIVTAIAEGKLNPSTKEAFDKNECSGLSLHRIAVKSISQLQKAEVPAQVRRENCFSVFGSHNTREYNTGKSCKLEKHMFIKLEVGYAWQTDNFCKYIAHNMYIYLGIVIQS